jgi:hypothetical protein
LDEDKDGLPNPLDADANGNGIVDAQEGTIVSSKIFLAHDRIQSYFLFQNFFNPASGFDNNFVLELIPKSSAVADILTVKVVAGPPLIDTAATDTFGSSWKNKGFALTNTTQGTGGTTKWAAAIFPNRLLTNSLSLPMFS